MGDMADYYGQESPEALDAFAQECAHLDKERAHANGIWITRDGRRIPIYQLEDAHLTNILRMLRKGAEGERLRRNWIYLSADVPHGDAASLAFEDEQREVFDSEWRAYVTPIFEMLERDCKRRGIEWNDMTPEQERHWVYSHDCWLLSKAMKVKGLSLND